MISDINSNSTLRVGLAGVGVVGCGVLSLLEQNRELVAARAGRNIVVTHVSARSKNRTRPVDISHYGWIATPEELANHHDVDVVVELMGGHDGSALKVCCATLEAGKPLVTANKALLAHHGLTLEKLAVENGVSIGAEAAVAGGVPVMKVMGGSLGGNRMTSVQGILNGTCNYILTTMRHSGRDFANVLEEAMRLGYAESDPTLDIEGIDAAHKLALLTALTFGVRPAFDQLPVTGITKLTPQDHAFAAKHGYIITLIGMAQEVMHNGTRHIEHWLRPVMLAESHPIARVEGVDNVVTFTGDPVGQITLSGPGAGGGSTASAVVSDLIDIATGRTKPLFGRNVTRLENVPFLPKGESHRPFYLRMKVQDRLGVLADISTVLKDNDISIDSMSQESDPSNPDTVSLLFVTHNCYGRNITKACETITNLQSVEEAPYGIPILR